MFYFIIYMFIKTLIFFLSSVVITCLISADLTLVEYDPLIFELQFSEKVPRTSFQLLYNNIYNITYTYETQSQFSSFYRIKADTTGIQKKSALQSYNLLFNNPLNVGNGRLDISSFALTAKKSDIMIGFPTAIGIVLVLSGYFFNTITGIGKIIVQFIQIYVLFMFQSRMTTTINQELYECLLLIPPSNLLVQQIGDYESFILCCLSIPVLVILLFGVIGTIYKRFSVGQKSILGTIIYQQLVFNELIKNTRVFLFNLLYNSIMFIRITEDQTVLLSQITVYIGYIFVYFNLLTCLAILYLKFYILNPNITKHKENRQNYLKSKQYQSFKQLHQRVHLSPWYKRNYDILQTLKVLIIIGTFFTNNMFQYIALLIEFIHFFFIFTVRPLIQQFYLNAKFICHLLIFIEYLLIVLGNLYFSLGEVTFNYYSASKYIVARDTMFLIIQLVIIGIVFGQIYFKCSNLKYHIKLVREADAFKLELVEKNKQDSESKQRKHTTTAYSQQFSKSSEKRLPSFSQMSSPHHKKRDSTLPGMHLKNSAQLKNARNKSKSRIQIQMTGMSDLKREVQKQIRQQKAKSIAKDGQKSVRKQKWKQQSLLQGIVKTK